MNTQKIEVPLSLLTFSAGGTNSIDFAGVQPQLAGRIVHYSAIKFVVAATPTLSSGTMTIEEAVKAIRSLVIRDGTGRTLFNGSGASLRLLSAVERGALWVPEPDAAATTEPVYFELELPNAPGNPLDPEDFVQPAALLRGGSITVGWGALTDVDANCTALTLTVQAYVVCELRDECVFGSFCERYETTYTNGQALGQEALYAFLALCDSSAFGAITAGDIANVETIVNGFSRQAIHVCDLERMYHSDMRSGPFTIVHGEPRVATDDNPKVTNGTAIAAASALVSPIIWNPQRGAISKLVYQAMPNLVLKWSGSAANAYLLASRILPRTDADVGKQQALVKSAMAVAFSDLQPRTESKAAYRGPRAAYMPLKAKVA